MTIDSLKPAVTKSWLIAMAGLMWTAVGVMLCRAAYDWFAMINETMAIGLALFGVAMAVAAYHFGFSKIARRNSERISLLVEKTCIFAFQTWKGYLIVSFMITLGAILRNSTIPKQYLAIIYTTIGGAILLSSFHYYGLLWKLVVQKDPLRSKTQNNS